MIQPERVEVWDSTNYELIESRREYIEGSVILTTREDHMNVPRNVTVYMDTETGILTTDVAKFEKWIAGLGK